MRDEICNGRDQDGGRNEKAARLTIPRLTEGLMGDPLLPPRPPARAARYGPARVEIKMYR